MVVVFVGSMLAGVVRQFPTYSNASSNLRAFVGGCGLADDVLVEPDSNAGFLTPEVPGDWGPLGPLGGTGPVGFTPNGVPDHIVAEALRVPIPAPGTDYDWDAPVKLTDPGVNGSTVPLPYGLDPKRVPVAGSFVGGPLQQQSLLTSAWYGLPQARRRAPPGRRHGGGHDHRQQRGQRTRREPDRRARVRADHGPDGNPVPGGRVVPYDLGPTPSWRNLRFDRSQIPADATAVRIVVEDKSLTQGDWVAVTPPRVPELRSVQEYVGSTQPVLMDWAVGLAFPCQQPMLHADGVTEIPKFRITPDYSAKKLDTDTWQDGVNGGLLGHQRSAAAGPRDVDVPVEGLGQGLGLAAQVRHARRRAARGADARYRDAQRAVVARQDPHQAVAHQDLRERACLLPDTPRGPCNCAHSRRFWKLEPWLIASSWATPPSPGSWRWQFDVGTSLFAETPPEAWQENADLLVPTFLDPETQRWRVMMQSWVIRVDGLTVVVDTGVGNDRDRPHMPGLANLSTDFLAALERGRGGPERR